ncbi:MAG TPA: AbrB/MazE/SpoVT family DNA-binding domain-containing protein [Solirubrobacterales bacterium]|nr:AbrB/MazE/SpoVT family DNA-binding domain-containing protein [Solirubrobacterales bacterium]
MDVAAKMTSKGQITVPKAVRERLELEPGDQVLFRLHGDRAVLARTPNFLDLAGVVPVPPEKRGASWDQIRREAWRARGERLKEQT